MNTPVTIQLPVEPSVVINHGAGAVDMFDDGYTGTNSARTISPMRRAAAVARLRALANLLEEEGLT